MLPNMRTRAEGEGEGGDEVTARRQHIVSHFEIAIVFFLTFLPERRGPLPRLIRDELARGGAGVGGEDAAAQLD